MSDDPSSDGPGSDAERPDAPPGDEPTVDGAPVFDQVRQLLTGDPTLTLEQVADQADLPVQILRELFAAMSWHERDAYDERDVAYARDLASLLDLYPLDTVVRAARTRYRAMASIVVADLGTVRDEVVTPALAAGVEPEQLAGRLADTAARLIPLVTRHLSEDYRHILLDLLDSEAVARGVSGGREVELAVGFVDVAGYTALSGRIDPAGLDHVLSGFEELVNEAVARAEHVLVAKFIGDAAMLVSPDPLPLARLLLELVGDRARLAEAPRKAGLAAGPVLVREGDYYGPTTNLAARLTDHARPWSLLAANDLRDRLDGEFSLSSVPETQLRGVGAHRPVRVRAAEDRD